MDDDDDLYGDMSNTAAAQNDDDLYGDEAAVDSSEPTKVNAVTDANDASVMIVGVEDGGDDSDSDDDIEITITAGTSRGNNQQGLRLRRNVWASNSSEDHGNDRSNNLGEAESSSSGAKGSSSSSSSSSALGDGGDLMREENPHAVRLDPDSYPDDAPLATADGRVFRFNQHRKHTAFDQFSDMSVIRGDKNWLKEGEDMSDYFNYGMDEEQWTAYAKEQSKKRNKLNFLRYLENNKIARPTPEELESMKRKGGNGGQIANQYPNGAGGAGRNGGPPRRARSRSRERR
jgi:pre-mRNA 3'-end-processing factor FIP1